MIIITKSFWEKLNTELIELNDTAIIVKMNIEDFHKRDIGIVHGGAICSLIDSTIKRLVNYCSNKTIKVSNSKVSFFLPGKGSYLLAKANIFTKSANHITVQCFVEDENGNIIAMGTSTAKPLQNMKVDVPKETILNFEFKPEDEVILAPYIIERDRSQPFREYLNVKRTIWQPTLCEVEVEIKDDLREPDGTIPHAVLNFLTDMSSGQTLMIKLPEGGIGLTIELTSQSFCNFDDSTKLISRSKILKYGKIVTTQSVILNEHNDYVGMGLATFYTKINK